MEISIYICTVNTVHTYIPWKVVRDIATAVVQSTCKTYQQYVEVYKVGLWLYVE